MKTVIHSPRIVWQKSFEKLERQFEMLFRREIEGCCDSLLDVGCGFDSPVRLLQVKPTRIIGIDIFEPALLDSKNKGIHNEYVQLDVMKIDEKFTPKSIDCVVLLDVIEHLTEENGLILISKMEKIARKKVIIFTPNGFVPQGEEYGNPWQRHISGWSVPQMKSFGYRVDGIGGLSILKGELARICWKPQRLWQRLSLLTQPITQRIPSLAFALLCVKKMDC